VKEWARYGVFGVKGVQGWVHKNKLQFKLKIFDHSPALGVLGPENITNLPVEHPWGDKHEAKYQFTYTETV